MIRTDKILIVGSLLLLLPLVTIMGQIPVKSKPDEATTVKKDTAEVEDNPFAHKKDPSQLPIDSARLRGETNPIAYRMDRRYINEGDSTMDRRWYKNMFMEIGLGTEKLATPTSNYDYYPFTTFHLGLGMQIGKYHSVRGIAEGTVGYMKAKDLLYTRAEAKVDHLFDLSSYFDGYDPTRLLSFQTILGAGIQYAELSNPEASPNENFGFGLEVHGGLQLRFNTGPHASFNVEPYFGVGPDRIDLNTNNWRKTAVFYGVNLNYIYYFSNHLTRAKRLKLLSEHESEIVQDSLLRSWQTPWFFEVAAGPAVFDSEQLSLSETLGHGITMSIGRWLSPVIGIKVSGGERMVTWSKHIEWKDNVTGFKTRHEIDQKFHYLSGRVDAIINPFGFKKKFTWDDQWGIAGMVGYELGWMSKTRTQTSLRCWSEAYSVAAHAYFRLGEGVQAFVEPRFTHNQYKIPYQNVAWNKQYSDNTYSLNIGITATGLGRKFRPTPKSDEESEPDPGPRRFVMGIGGGTNMIQQFYTYVDEHKMPLNANFHAQYNFNAVSSIRLGAEWLSHSATDYTNFIYLNKDLQEQLGVGPMLQQGLWNHTYYFVMASLDYGVNLTNWMRGYRPNRKFEVEIFGGPTMTNFLGQTGHLSDREAMKRNSEGTSKEGVKQGFYMGANGGVKLSYFPTRHFGFFVSPQLFYLHNIDTQAINLTKAGLFEALDLGVQIGF